MECAVRRGCCAARHPRTEANLGQGSRKHSCTSIPSPRESFGPSHTLPNGAAGPVFRLRYGMPRDWSGSKGSRRHLVRKIMNECEHIQTACQCRPYPNSQTQRLESRPSDEPSLDEPVGECALNPGTHYTTLPGAWLPSSG